MDDGHLPEWKDMQAPLEARTYYGLPDNATFRDIILAVRADEAMHREHNHHFAELNANDDVENDTYEILRREQDVTLGDKLGKSLENSLSHNKLTIDKL